MAPTTEPAAMVTEAAPVEDPKESSGVKEVKKKKAGMKKKESDVDYVALEKKIAEIKSNAAGSSAEKLLSETLEELLALEKTYRLQADLKATSMCGVAVVQACFEARQWKLLNEHVILISKRRAQLKQAVGATVKEAIGYLDSTPDEETKVELIKTLTSVTEGKIYLELERARLTRKLADILEARGKIDEAATALQEVAVETFGVMAKTEKIAFILEQVRLCLKKEDFIRAFILVKKITPRAFTEKRLVSDGKSEGGEKKEMAMDGTTAAPPDKGIPSLEELKLVYYDHLIAYYKHVGDALEMCRCYQNIYDTPCIKKDASKWPEVLKKVCWYVVLAPSGPMQNTILHNVYEDENLAKIQVYEKLLRIFVKTDIVEWIEVETQFGPEMMEQSEIFMQSDKGQENRDIFKRRVVEKNILVVACYYTHLQLTRLADILKIDVEEAEKYLCALVTAGTIKAKIDRPRGVVIFGTKAKPDEVLSKWSGNISRLLDVLEKSAHLIQKECQTHKEDLKPAPNESLKENPNTLAVLKPLAPSEPDTTTAAEAVEAEEGAPADAERPTEPTVVAEVRNTAPTPAPPVNGQNRARFVRRKILDSVGKDYFLYLKQAYQFSSTVSHSRLQLVEKKGKSKTSKLFVPDLLDSGLGVQRKLTGDVAPKHFIFTPLRANNIPGPGKGIHKFLRVARVMLLQGTKFVGNQEKFDTFPALLENRRWKFHEQRLVVRYNPELENLKLYIEFNFEHQLSANDKLGLALNDRHAKAQVTEGTMAWCVVPVSICSQIQEETIVPVKLMTGSLTNPIKLDDIRASKQTGIQKRLQDACGYQAASCYPSKQSLFTLKVAPMNYSSNDFRYLPANFITNVKLATVITLHQIILRDQLKESPSFLDQTLEPVLASFPHILDDDMMKHNFLLIWDIETGRVEQTKDKLYACFHECVMRFWPLLSINNLGETYSNEFNSNALRKERIRQFVSQRTEITLAIGGHAWSHKPFQISELRYSLGDTVAV